MNGVPLQFVYLVFVLTFFPIWLCLFFSLKELRKALLVAGFFNATAGFLLEWFIWTKDWVHSLTLSGTPAGIEDILLGFFLAGISMGFFEMTSRLRGRKNSGYQQGFALTIKIWASQSLFLLGTILICRLIPFNHSFYASLAVMAFMLAIFFCIRRDLICDSLLAGVGLAIASIPAYLVAFYTNAEFPLRYWQWQNLSGLTFLGIPIEDLIWFFFAGTFLAPFYEFWYGLYRGKKLASEKPACA